MSAALVSRIGLPLSQVSTAASFSKLASMRSAILLRILERSVTEVRPHASLAACAASNANSVSSAPERAPSQQPLPVAGVMFSKYCPLPGGTHLPPIKLSYRFLKMFCGSIVFVWFGVKKYIKIHLRDGTNEVTIHAYSAGKLVNFF